MVRRPLLALLVTSTMALVVPLWATRTAIGFTAGATGAASVYPVDFVKTQRQTASGKREFAGLSLPATLVHMVNRDGPLSVFRGLGVQVAGVAPEKAIKLTVNDAARSALDAHRRALRRAIPPIPRVAPERRLDGNRRTEPRDPPAPEETTCERLEDSRRGPRAQEPHSP